jgi:hypothetical protein
MEAFGEYWRFTHLSLLRLFEEVFREGQVEARAHGSVLAATAFLHGFAAEDIPSADLDRNDPDFEVLITLRAVKSPAALSPGQVLGRDRIGELP